MDLGVDRVVGQRLLVGADGAVDLALRRPRVAEPDVGVGVERAQLDRLVVRLDGLVEEATRRRQEQISERLVRPRVRGIELGGGAELCGGLPAVAEHLVHGAERVLGDDEVGVDLDRPREEVHRALVGLLPAARGGHLRAREQLEGAHRLGRRRGLLHAARLGLGERHLQRPGISGRQRGEANDQLALRHAHRLHGHGLPGSAAELEDLRLKHELVVGAGDPAVERGVDAQVSRGLHHGGLAPGLRLTKGAQARPVELDKSR